MTIGELYKMLKAMDEHIRLISVSSCNAISNNTQKVIMKLDDVIEIGKTFETAKAFIEKLNIDD